jgi:hypothetical protein
VASLTAVRKALANQILTNTLPLLAAVEAEPLDQIPNLPAALIFPGKPVAKYGVTMGEALPFLGSPAGRMMAATDFNLQVMIVVSQGSTIERVQGTLDQFLGFENIPGQTVSIPTAVALDPTLGGVVFYCEAMQVSSYGPIEYNGNSYFGARIDFTIGA